MDETHDQLTGVKNSRALFLELTRLLKNPEQRVALLWLNVDNFKAVNDRYGHISGDEALRTIGRLLMKRTLDCYRQGGNEFVIIARSLSKPEAFSLAESIRTEIGGHVFEDHRDLRVTVHIGVSVAPQDADAPEQLVQCAEDARYKARREGGNCVRPFDLSVRIESLEIFNAHLQKRIAYLEDLHSMKLREENRIASEGAANVSLSDLERAYDLALEVFVDALAMRDPKTADHSRRVTTYTIAIARKMGLLKEEINVIARAAFLHDVGKLAIPDAILRKPETLTAEETALMRQYVCSGYNTIKRIPFVADAAEIVYCHQERFDSKGYPRGLKGKEIPIGARIVAVANALDSITSDLPYRKARSFEAARHEIEHWSGHQFDPEIVRIFLSIPETVWEDLRKDIVVCVTNLKDAVRDYSQTDRAES